ncbi:type II CAAX prenyl endopeptidase Rce1 family protein [Clostridium sp. UBA1652]|uniref:CPBP family glutamic-type intramembrane protease n=1 Tax=Clostridium sp. UBA1652 TaxID=1946348 RepID=UPI0039C86F40
MIFTIIIVSPITEEIVFCELLPYATGPSYLSFIISSIIFILLHAPVGLMGWTSYGILTAVFLYARLKDNNIYTELPSYDMECTIDYHITT